MTIDRGLKTLDEALKEFDRNSAKEFAEKGELERVEILKWFPLDGWPTLPLERYAVGQQNSDDTFCRWAEFGSPNLGSIKGGSAHKLIIYKHKNEPGWFYPAGYVDEQKAWVAVRKAFVQAFEFARDGNWEAIDDLEPLSTGPALRVKTLHIYFPTDIVPIYSRPYIQHYLGLMDVPEANDSSWDVVRFNRALVAAIRKHEGFSGWSLGEAAYFLDQWNNPRTTTRYWKIAPGSNATDWERCSAKGYIALGWDEVGDMAKLKREEFDARCAKLAAKYKDEGWTVTGMQQLWRFAHEIEVGDRIVANRGTREVIGIGRVTGKYFFVPDQDFGGHRLPVEWYDRTPRAVNEGGWRRTLIELDGARFEAILAAPRLPSNAGSGTEHHPGVSDAQPSESAFSPLTFELLTQLHGNPTRAFYAEHKQEFKEYLEDRFKAVLRDVAAQLPETMKDKLETEKHVFAHVLKNDFGQGGAWDYYWGAFYPKGGKRIAGAQLYVWMNNEVLKFGFSVGDYGVEERERLQRNCSQNRDALVRLLRESTYIENMMLGPDTLSRETPREAIAGGSQPTFADWLADPAAAEYTAAVRLPRDHVLRMSQIDLVSRVSNVFQRLYPLVLLATEDNPIPAITDYLNLPEEEEEKTEVYSLERCAEESGLGVSELESWVGAIRRKKQAIIYGPPGTGKTYVARLLAKHLIGGGNGLSDLVQFHPAYAYEDFIQGIRPQSGSDGALVYPMVPGRFLEFCAEARTRKDACVLIIDEINRANLARVFGELMYLLEYRDDEIPLAGGGAFRIPKNVIVIGTMNTADRSIALVDHALRRRFAFLALYPNYEILRRYHAQTGIDIAGLIATLKQLNERIEDPHYAVGISFFLRENLRDEIKDIWRMEIEPYLEEYFFDRKERTDEFRWNKVGEKIALWNKSRVESS